MLVMTEKHIVHPHLTCAVTRRLSDSSEISSPIARKFERVALAIADRWFSSYAKPDKWLARKGTADALSAIPRVIFP